MRQRTLITSPQTEARMLDITGLCVYLGLGRNKALAFGREAGALKRIGRRALYDKKIIDQALDELEAD